MFTDGGSLPVGGSVLVAGLVYAGISLFVTGPVIGERTIAMSGWDRQCRTAVARRMEAERPRAPNIPDIGCGTVFGTMFGEEGQAWCRKYGGGFKVPFLDQLREQQRRAEELNEQRFEAAAADAGSRCSCAANLTLEERRVPLAIHAGSLRLVTPPAVKNLDSELRASLGSPRCAMKG